MLAAALGELEAPLQQKMQHDLLVDFMELGQVETVDLVAPDFHVVAVEKTGGDDALEDVDQRFQTIGIPTPLAELAPHTFAHQSLDGLRKPSHGPIIFLGVSFLIQYLIDLAPVFFDQG